jgi:hypothetical protein
MDTGETAMIARPESAGRPLAGQAALVTRHPILEISEASGNAAERSPERLDQCLAVQHVRKG